MATVTQLPAADDARRSSKTSRGKYRADSLVRDERVQRSLIPARVRKLRDNIDLDGIGVITVSLRPNGDRVIIDGQHRIQALIESNLGDRLVECYVYHNLKEPEEAALFRLLNNTRVPSAYDDFTKGVIAGDVECVDINAIVERAGLTVTQQTTLGGVRAVGAMRTLYRGKNGPQALADTLKVATGAWGRVADGLDGHILAGIGLVIARYGDEIDLPALTRKLAKREGGPLALLGDARGLRRLRGGNVARSVAVIVTDTYNRGRRSGQLAPL